MISVDFRQYHETEISLLVCQLPAVPREGDCIKIQFLGYTREFKVVSVWWMINPSVGPETKIDDLNSVIIFLVGI